MKPKLAVALAVGTVILAGCSDSDVATPESESSPEYCYLASDVAILGFDWALNFPNGDYLPSETDIANAHDFAERVKDMSWSIPDGSDCVGYRESLILTREALILADAMEKGTVTDADYSDVADAGDELMQVVRLEEQGYEPERCRFVRTAEEADERIPG